jgi:hypothetical protein
MFGSLRCDCGDQLRNAVARLNAAGGGVLLYLDQEGRGIGIGNKMRAYSLQDDGFDTIDANSVLGFEPDERRYDYAAAMLAKLGYPPDHPADQQSREDRGAEPGRDRSRGAAEPDRRDDSREPALPLYQGAAVQSHARRPAGPRRPDRAGGE